MQELVCPQDHSDGARRAEGKVAPTAAAAAAAAVVARAAELWAGLGCAAAPTSWHCPRLPSFSPPSLLHHLLLFIEG